MRRRRQAGRQTRIHGALALGLIVLAAIVGWISFNALSGLPLQSRYTVTVLVPDAQRLVATDDVRIAGVRVGQVQSLRAEQGSDGRVHAGVTLNLDRSVQLPIDSAVAIGSVSPLGATYVGLTPGKSAQVVKPGGILPIARARPRVAVTDLFDIFDGNAAQNFRTATRSLAYGFAGRGADLNPTLQSMPTMLASLTSVTDALASRRARVAGFARAFARAGDALAPVARQTGDLVAAAGTTFGALAANPRALRTAIQAFPRAERDATVALTSLQPALRGLAKLAPKLARGTRRLPVALRAVNRAARAGIPAMRALAPLTSPLRTVMRTLRAVSRPAYASRAFRGLADMIAAVSGMLDAMGPAQAYCNAYGLFVHNVASASNALGYGDGPTIPLVSLTTRGQPGEQVQSAKPAPHAHINNSPTEREGWCDSNNENYDPNGQRLAPPSDPSGSGASTRSTEPPPGVLARAQAAGLLATRRPGR